MAKKRPEGTHNPSKKSLQTWDAEGGAPKGGRPKRPRDVNQFGKFMVDLATMDEAEREKLQKEIAAKRPTKKTGSKAR